MNLLQVLWRDVVLWKRLSHENVIPFYGVDTTRHFRLAFAYPWAENQDIQRYPEANNGASRLDLVTTVPHFSDKRPDGDPRLTAVSGN